MDSITGLVVPSGWDEHGQVAAVAIATDQEEEYAVETGAAAPSLMGHVYRSVIAYGHVKKHPSPSLCQWTILVTHFVLI